MYEIFKIKPAPETTILDITIRSAFIRAKIHQKADDAELKRNLLGFKVDKIMSSSSRLYFRPCTLADTDLLLQHWVEPMVRRYLFDDRVIERNTVRCGLLSSNRRVSFVC